MHIYNIKSQENLHTYIPSTPKHTHTHIQAFKGESIPEEDIARVAPFIENQARVVVHFGSWRPFICFKFTHLPDFPIRTAPPPPPQQELISFSPLPLPKPPHQSQDFTPENVTSKSAAAANLCTWVVNIYRYNRIYVKARTLPIILLLTYPHEMGVSVVYLCMCVCMDVCVRADMCTHTTHRHSHGCIYTCV